MRSHPGIREDLFPRGIHNALITDFFGGVSRAEMGEDTEDIHLDVPESPAQVAPTPLQQVTVKPVTKRNYNTPDPQGWRSWAGLVVFTSLLGYVALGSR